VQVLREFSFGPRHIGKEQPANVLQTLLNKRYDPVGNRLSSLGVSPYNYNASNQLTSTPSITYTYDSNGNAATKVDTTGTTQYFWDFENRLKSVTLPGSGGTVTFKYDPFGRRIEKTTSSTTSIYAYDGDNLIEETNSSGAVVARYEDTQNIDEPLAMLRSSTTSYYHADGLGSVTSLSSSAGWIANTYTYDSFGKLTASTGSLVNPFRYTARESDMETALYFLRARYFDAASGRFLSEDLVRFNGGASFYAYVSNSPLNFVDPFGLDKCKSNDCKNNNPYPGYRGPYKGQFGPGFTPWKVPYGPNVPAAYGDATGGPFNQNLNDVSRKFGNNTWSNCVRGCLLSAWDPCKKQYHPGFYSAHITCYAICTGSLLADDGQGGRLGDGHTSACEMGSWDDDCLWLAALFHEVDPRDPLAKRNTLCIRLHLGTHRSRRSPDPLAGSTIFPTPRLKGGRARIALHHCVCPLFRCRRGICVPSNASLK
jgi:RHS repeat-associated protein